MRQAADDCFRWLTGNRKRECGERDRERERVMVTFVPSRDHQKRASKILLTHHLPPSEGGRRVYSLNSHAIYEDTNKNK